MAKQSPRQEPVAGSTPSTKWFKPQAPNFVKLKEGNSVEGIYLGPGHSQYGISYKFYDPDTKVNFTLGGNRAQLDQVFAELAANPQGFVGDSIIGHYLIVMRLPAVESKQGRKVAQFQIGHVLDKCPKGCKG